MQQYRIDLDRSDAGDHAFYVAKYNIADASRVEWTGMNTCFHYLDDAVKYANSINDANSYPRCNGYERSAVTSR